MAGHFEVLDVMEPKVFESAGSDEVVVRSTLKLVNRGGGWEWIAPLMQIVTVDREKGIITESRPFYWDVAGLRKVPGK